MIEGTWRVIGKTIISDENTGWDDELNVRGYGGHLVCESIPSPEIGHLIAAAPDMYRALEKAVDVIKTWHGYGDSLLDQAWSIYMKASPEMEPIRKALAKARGESA